ncbi:hypothetical protein RchiOBHm_Chr4g0426241 [Rosa chinensis]|uniref:Uncharacterized protein n=1 Tax=Rosa chinensis TaxID=74649 RepID=A0A2P6QZC4_ROSCH|nr:hypothetical protein RchiOBHm_Chr4g0426241 [Rosa chinensis]
MVSRLVFPQAITASIGENERREWGEMKKKKNGCGFTGKAGKLNFGPEKPEDQTDSFVISFWRFSFLKKLEPTRTDCFGLGLGFTKFRARPNPSPAYNIT